MGTQTGPGRSSERRRPSREPRREHDVIVVRSMLLAALAGVAAVVSLAVLSATADVGTTATVAISAVAAIISTAIGAAAAYLHRRR